MRLENLLALTEAKLVNEPCVSSFENIIFDASRVKRGDLFIASSIQDIDLAVSNGAYGIVYDRPVSITDAEIAWIEVVDIKIALEKLLRFRLIQNNIVAYECDEIVLKLASQIVTNENLVVATMFAEKLFKQLWQLEPRTTLLFSSTFHERDIFTNIKKIQKNPNSNIDIMEQTLFETSFIYNNKYYERQLISPFFMPYLEELFHLYDKLNINFRLRKFNTIDNFEAVFTNKKLEIKDFGASDKVLIFEKNTSLIQKEIDFLQSKASWANIIYILPQHVDINDDTGVFRYKDKDEIKQILKENKFHFALVVGVDKSILSNKITNTSVSLFDTQGD